MQNLIESKYNIILSYVCEGWIVFIDDNVCISIEVDEYQQWNGVNYFNSDDTSSH